MTKVPAFSLIEPSQWLFKSHGDVVDGTRRAFAYKDRHGSLDGAENQIEEFVRQWALRFLLDEYGYPEEWIGERIIIEEPVKMGSTFKEADCCALGLLRHL